MPDAIASSIIDVRFTSSRRSPRRAAAQLSNLTAHRSATARCRPAIRTMPAPAGEALRDTLALSHRATHLQLRARRRTLAFRDTDAGRWHRVVAVQSHLHPSSCTDPVVTPPDAMVSLAKRLRRSVLAPSAMNPS